MTPAVARSRPSASSLLVAALCVLLSLAACTADNDVDPTDSPGPPGTVTVHIDDRDVLLGEGACIWYEASGQLFVEAGDAEGADYILLAAPLQWLGEPLPEGPGGDPELSLRLGGADLAVDQTTLEGVMNADQTDGTFLGTLADGRAFSGEWACSEVLEG